MTLKHNKKRNVGLINEFFARYIAAAIIQNDDVSLKEAKNIFSNFFRKGTELHKELLVFNSLVNTKLSSKEAACSLLENAKIISKTISEEELDKEKSALLFEMNLRVGNKEFFNPVIPNYKIYATVQVLLNHWRSKILTENIGIVAELEEKLVSFITSSERNQESNHKNVLEMTGSDVDGFVIKLMTEKLNKKYGDLLNEPQRKLINLYVFSNEDNQAKENLINKIGIIKESIKKKINKAIGDESISRVHDKFRKIEEMLKEDVTEDSVLNDQTILFYLDLAKLDEELSNE